MFNRISKHACFYIPETTYDKQHILSSKKSNNNKKKRLKTKKKKPLV